ncbi:cold shock domain-containing protein [Micromonospora sp. DT229]|uniref:cold shock domain-containing protein n=1 Tax=Micromonospora sp. DT229 TaxID=3393430 RepID=UPI003CEE9CE0
MSGPGVVRIYHSDEGWGVIDGAEVPGGCWVHFSAIAMNAYRQLAAGQEVSFIAEPVAQDGFAYRAVKVWTTETEPLTNRETVPSPARTTARWHWPLTNHPSLTGADSGRPGRPSGQMIEHSVDRPPHRERQVCASGRGDRDSPARKSPMAFRSPRDLARPNP